MVLFVLKTFEKDIEKQNIKKAENILSQLELHANRLIEIAEEEKEEEEDKEEEENEVVFIIEKREKSIIFQLAINSKEAEQAEKAEIILADFIKKIDEEYLFYL